MRGLSPALAYTLIMVGLAGLLALLAWSARRGRPAAGPGGLLIRHSTAFRVTALVTALAIPVTLMIAYSILPPVREEGRYVLIAFAVILAVTLPMFWEAARYYVFADAHGLECRSPWRAPRYFAWDDVREVTFSPATGWFAFRGWDGDRIRVPATAAGVPDLLRIVETHVSPSVLKRARAGWGRVGRSFPHLPDEPTLEARPPRRA
jgi:Bacterial PH domain